MRKSSTRTSHYRAGSSLNGVSAASFGEQMADHFARGEELKRLRTERHSGSQEHVAAEIGPARHP
jgi:hypothetical protein